MKEYVVNLINDAIDKRRKTLDLTGLGLYSHSPELDLLKKCTHLETLVLNSNESKIQEGSTFIVFLGVTQRIDLNKFEVIPVVVKYLRNLKKLIFHGNNNSKIEFIENLPESLEYLDLKDHSVEVLKIEGEKITFLDLSKNNIRKVISLPKNIEVLNIESNYISNFQNLNENYNKLKKLNINHNNIAELNFNIFPNLEIIYFNNNNVAGVLTIPNKARLIDASMNKIEKLIFNENSSNVVLINLYKNRITSLPREYFSAFENHNYVYLYEDQTIIRELKNALVKSQMYEDAAETRDIESELMDSDPLSIERVNYLVGIFTRGNNLSSPPKEIIFQGLNSIKKWYNSKRDYLKDVKIVLLGEPKSGKTSLINRLFNGEFNENEDQTDGINIIEVDFRYNKLFKENTKIHDVTGRVWDFGGQDILNSTHHCFLTNRSVYIVCLESRIDTNVASQVKHWVKRVKATAGDSPVIVIVNKIDQNPGFEFTNEKDISNEYPFIIGFIKVSCKSNEGIAKLRDLIENTISSHEVINTKIDHNWILLKNRLMDSVQGKKYISEEGFKLICEEIKFESESDKANSISFLNDLGIITHFNNRWIPKFYVFDPLWITYGLYQIITSQLVAKKFGAIRVDDIEYIVNDEEDKTKPYNIHEYHKVKYSNSEVKYLIEVLLTFKLAYLSFNRDVLILPDLLRAKEPKEVSELFKIDETIEIEYRYEYLSSNILIELMILLNNFLSFSWRTGFVFKIANNYCLVHSYDNSIFIKTSKSISASESITIVRLFLSQINIKLTEQPKILVPLPDKAAYVDLQELIGRLSAGEPIYKVYTPKVAEYEITKLLYGFELEPKFETILNKIKSLDDGQIKLYDHFSKIEQNLSKILTEVVKEIRDDINKYEESLFESPAEQSVLMSKVDEILQKMDDKPDDELWHDREPTTKIKAILPLIIFQFEKEMIIKDFKMPKTWKEFKRWFIKEV